MRDESYCDPIHPPVPPPMPPARFKLEAVVVCDGYSDFLRHTLPQNKHLFDRIVVVTSYEDLSTQKMCEFHHVECVLTDKTNSRKKEFCKGSAINEGLSNLSLDGWVVHFDADIWMPPQTRILLEKADLDRTMVYGCDRFIVKGVDAWEEFLDRPVLQHEDNTWVHLNAFLLGTRVTVHGVWSPIGFFQLWHPTDSGIRNYPEGHTSAAREDTIFSCFWPRSKRSFLPELVVYHLESNDSTIGANWRGRRTKPFTHDGQHPRFR